MKAGGAVCGAVWDRTADAVKLPSDELPVASHPLLLSATTRRETRQEKLEYGCASSEHFEALCDL